VTREDLEQDKERGLDGTTVGYSNGFKRSGMSDEEFIELIQSGALE
jgi:hypothetical protein